MIWGGPSLSASPVAASFHCDGGTVVFKATVKLEREGIRREQIKMTQSCLFLPRCGSFSLGCCKPFVNFQSFGKVDFHNFADSLLFWRSGFSRGPYSHAIALVLLPLKCICLPSLPQTCSHPCSGFPHPTPFQTIWVNH